MGASHNWIGPQMAFRDYVWGVGGAVLSLSLTLLARRQLTDSDDGDAHQSTNYLF